MCEYVDICVAPVACTCLICTPHVKHTTPYTPHIIHETPYTQASIGADLNVSLAGKVGVSMPATAVDLVHPTLTNKTFVYSATKGFMLVDSSVKGVLGGVCWVVHRGVGLCMGVLGCA